MWSLALKVWRIIVWWIFLVNNLSNLILQKFMTLIVNLVWYLSAVNHRMLNVECFLDYQWPMGPRSTPPTILVANGSTIKSYPLFMKYTVLGFMEIMPHESLILWFHGPWNTLRRVHGKFNSLKVLFHGFMAHEILCDKFS